MTRIAVVQPALQLGEVDRNLARIETLIRDAHREHNAEVVVVPEGFTTPNVFAKVLKATPRPVDGAPFQLLARLARDLECVVAGGFIAKRGAHTYGTYVLAEPGGPAHLHDKDIPTAWEQNYYRGGDDDGVVYCEALSSTVGLMSGWEWARFRTAERVRAGGARLVIGGMCWPSVPLNWPAPLSIWAKREHAIWRRQCRELPGQVARLVGAPVAYAAHVGPITGETPLGPGIPWGTEMIGDSQICDRDGTVLARLALEDGEGHVSADVELSDPVPLDPILDRFWIFNATVTEQAAWHAMNAHGTLGYKTRYRRKLFPWQQWPNADLADEIPDATETHATAATRA